MYPLRASGICNYARVSECSTVVVRVKKFSCFYSNPGQFGRHDRGWILNKSEAVRLWAYQYESP